jgi:hypothetical protein
MNTIASQAKSGEKMLEARNWLAYYAAGIHLMTGSATEA